VTVGTAGSIVLGVFCAAGLALTVAGAIVVVLEQRNLKLRLARIEETQRLTFDSQRLESALARIARNAQAARELLERARRATATVTTAMRFFAVAARIVNLLR
jgi:hypothetical protein